MDGSMMMIKMSSIRDCQSTAFKRQSSSAKGGPP